MKTAKEVIAAGVDAGLELRLALPANVAEVALAALREAGYCVVPREPTEAMLAAGAEETDYERWNPAIWAAMIGAAVRAEQEGGEG